MAGAIQTWEPGKPSQNIAWKTIYMQRTEEAVGKSQCLTVLAANEFSGVHSNIAGQD